MFFERMTFVYLKRNNCGRTDRTLAMGVSGAVVRFPISFKEMMWHATDAAAEFEMSAERLKNAFVGSMSPCKLEDGDCMGLDQLLPRRRRDSVERSGRKFCSSVQTSHSAGVVVTLHE